MERLKELGARWVRVHLSWKKVEPKKGTTDTEQLAEYDDVVNRLRKENYHVVLLLGGVPEWSGQTKKAKTKGGAKGWVPRDEYLEHIVQFVVSHFKGRVQYYQILNETTLPIHWTEPEQFARQMEIAYRAAKAKDPASRIIMGGFGTRGVIAKTEYLERFLKAGGSRYIDVFDFHMYNYISRIYREIPDLRAILKKYGVEKPIWILETGDPSNFTNEKVLKRIGRRDRYTEQGSWDWPVFDEEEQARRLVKRMVLAMSQGVEKVFWYSLQDRQPRDKVDPTRKRSGHRNTMGLIYTDFTPKKSFHAYKFLISKLSEAQFEKRLDTGEAGAVGFLFKSRAGRVAVIWTWAGSTQVELSLDGGDGRVYDKLGNFLGAAKPDKTNRLRLRVTTEPLYVFLQP